MAFQTAESIRSSFARQSKQHRKALKHPLLARRIQFKKSTLTQFRSSESSTTTRSSEPTIEESDQPPPPPVPPQNRLFPPSALSFEWDSIFPIGPGLNNLGNTCFLNSVLQCLTYTAPLANYLMTGHHMKTCKNTAFCLLCILENHIQTCFGGKPKSVVSPNAIVKRLKSVAKHMRVGRQEDAHEFLRYFIDGIQKSSLFGYEKLDNRLKETTLVYQIFGGHILSQVECLSCHYKSNTYDLILDLSLEIKHCDTLEKAFSHYSKPERLYKSNQYKCARCKKYVDAQKRLTIHDPPPVLTVQLKRFDFLRSGMKINKPIAFDEYLDLKPYMTVGQSTPSRYELYAVLVHAGGSCNSGHYYSFVRSSANTWYSMNDSEVRQVSVGTVLKQSAYILFYRLIQSPSNTKKENAQVSAEAKLNGKKNDQASPIGPSSRKRPLASKENKPSTTPKPSGDDIGSVVSRDDIRAKLNRKKLEKLERLKKRAEDVENYVQSQQATSAPSSAKSSQQSSWLTSNVQSVVNGEADHDANEDTDNLPSKPSGSPLKEKKIKLSGKWIVQSDVAGLSGTDGGNRQTNPSRHGWSVKSLAAGDVESKFETRPFVSNGIPFTAPTSQNTASQFDGLEVQAWDSVTAKQASERERIISGIGPKKGHKRPALWDLDYEKGRVKKVGRKAKWSASYQGN